MLTLQISFEKLTVKDTRLCHIKGNLEEVNVGFIFTLNSSIAIHNLVSSKTSGPIILGFPAILQKNRLR